VEPDPAALTAAADFELSIDRPIPLLQLPLRTGSWIAAINVLGSGLMMSSGRWPRSRERQLIRVARVCKRLARECRGCEQEGGNEHPTRFSAPERLCSTCPGDRPLRSLTGGVAGDVAVWPKIWIAFKTSIGHRESRVFVAVEDSGCRASNAQSMSVTVVRRFAAHDAGVRYRAEKEQCHDCRADGFGHDVSPCSRVDTQETEVANDLFQNVVGRCDRSRSSD
jgi:hypothetical protein